MINQKIKARLQFFAEAPVSTDAASGAEADPGMDSGTPEPDGGSALTSFAEIAEQTYQSMNNPQPEGGAKDPEQGEDNDGASPKEEPEPEQKEGPEQKEPPDPMKPFKDEGLTKFKDLGSFIKSYKNLESHSSRLAQENKKIGEDLEALKSMLLSQKEQGKESDPTAPGNDVDPLDALYADPEKFIQDRADKIVQEKLAAIQEPLNKQLEVLSAAYREQVRNTATSKFISEHPEFHNFMTDVAAMINADPEFYNLSDHEAVTDRLSSYLTIAKGNAYTEPPSVDKVLEEALQDEEMLRKYVLGNEKIRDRILEEAMNAAKKPPPTITKPGGNTMTPPAANQPSSFEELGDSLKKQYGLT